ncbi:MAG: asparaginase [Anaerolineaceae bacterium]
MMQTKDQVYGYEPIVELTRGGMVECVHYGALAVVDSNGRLLASAGDPDLKTFPRSSMKPFQVLPFVERHGIEAFGLTEEELAIMCASHSGTDAHVSVLKSIHRKIGLSEANLQCGVHWPSDKATADYMRANELQPTPFRHNCSGKHSGMLAHSRLRNLPLENYLDMTHPVQQSILEAVAEMCDLPTQELTIGTDGCSAPVFAMPLRNFALAVARLCDPQGLEPNRANSCRKIAHAMMNYPVMVAGPGKMDTCLMQVMQGKAVVKGGAEGYQMIGLMPGSVQPDSPGIGIAFKISDGDPSRRATQCLVAMLLKALGFVREIDDEAYSVFTDPVLHNWRGLEIGETRPAFHLDIAL